MLKVALGSALLVTASHGLALSLGGVQGNAIIGRPLDILVQGSIDPSEASAGLCLEAEVLYGDVKVPASAITAAIHRLGFDGKGAVRVRVSTAVNEPIVTVALKAGCPPTFTRQYTLLSDFDAAPVPVARDTGAVLAAPTANAPRDSAPPTTSVAGRSKAEAPSARAPAPRAESVASDRTPTPIRLHAPRPRPAGVVKLASKLKPVGAEAAETSSRSDAGVVRQDDPKPAVAPATPRLKLHPVEAPSTTTGTPNVSGTEAPAAEAPATAMPAPATAVAAPPTDGPVQKELDGLRSEQERLRIAVETMNRQLAQAEEARYNNPLVYGLGGLALALAGGLAWLLRRRPVALPATDASAAPWWTVKTREPDDIAADEPTPSATATTVLAVDPQADAPPKLEAGHTDLNGMMVSEASESVFLETPIAPIEIAALVDLWQQVAFFESLGQHAEASYALESFVRQYPRGSEAPYLFWLRLAFQQGDERGHARAQSLYEQHFHRVLSSQAANTSASMESDAVFLSRLADVWPDKEATLLIESALTSQPGDPQAPLQVRTAQSFDDLLVLHGMLEVLPSIANPTLPSQAADDWMTIGEVKAAAQEPPKVDPAFASTVAEPAPAPVLDFQLPEVEAAAPALEAAPEVKKELPSLDFEFHDFGSPPPKK